MFKKVIHAFGTMLAILSALWIITGSTVIFHQKYVYHNLLSTWQDMFLKTSSKDTKKYLKSFEKSIDSSTKTLLWHNGGISPEISMYRSFVKKLSSGFAGNQPLSDNNNSHPHRGPPAA